MSNRSTDAASFRAAGRILAAASAMLLMASGAAAQEVFAAHSNKYYGGNTTHTTGTQGQVGNDFCPPPTIYINGKATTPKNWSCPGDYQAKQQKLLGGVQDQNQYQNTQRKRQKLLGGTQRQGEQGWPTGINTGGNPLRWTSQSQSDPGYSPLKGLTRAQAERYAKRRQRLVNSVNVWMGNGYARAAGLREFEGGVFQSMNGKKFPFRSYQGLRSSMQRYSRR